MCGFAGILDSSRRTNNEALRATVGRMADTLRHRGPNDQGAWADQETGIALGFRRLSILDLSPQGHQPMCSAGGRYVIAFNGEIYNFRDLRRQLEEHWGDNHAGFRGHSDTEVLLAAIEAWGLPQALQRCAGMFAFALWDRAAQTLTLVRDRVGEKPLYYGWAGDVFIFGSELKALRAHPQFRREINRDALVPYLRHGYVPAPCSIYRGIYKLEPGAALELCMPRAGDLPEPFQYWSARAAAEAGALAPFTGSDYQAVEELESLLGESVGREMIADVPLGAFLSGGVDSSTIVALMQARSRRPVRTFTIGFQEAAYNEAHYAKAVAQHLGTEHTELYVTPAEAMAVIPRLPGLYDEPFADSSQIPTCLLSQLASRSVTVSLSGDGGDEIFGGYDWYGRSLEIWSKASRIPRRRMVGKMLTAAPTGRVRRAGELLADSGSLLTLHQSLLSRWGGAGQMVLDADEPSTTLVSAARWPDRVDPLQLLQCFDLMTYLPDSVLTKVDRASMAASLESRAPFLDHRIVEFAFRLPASMRRRDGRGKWLLRKLACKYVPDHLLDRPKGAFDVPLDEWLRGPLVDWAESMLDERELRQQGFLNARRVRRRWEEHLSGAANRQDDLWHVLMFQAWLDNEKRS